MCCISGHNLEKGNKYKNRIIAWISKADTPNYPIITIQYFWFSTRKPFGSKWILNFTLHLLSLDKLFSEKNARNVRQTYTGRTQSRLLASAWSKNKVGGGGGRGAGSRASPLAAYFRWSVALSPCLHQPFPILFYPSITEWQAIT